MIFFPEETTFAVRNKENLEIVYAGPEYIPSRNGHYKSMLYLLPGEYTFEVYDITGNGLVSGLVQNTVPEDGSWTLSALYDDYTETELASGGPTFNDQQVTKFIVSERGISNKDVGVSKEMDACLVKIELENNIGASYSTKCECTMNETLDQVQLTCKDANNEQCGANHESCYLSSQCCSGRRCSTVIGSSNGKCRSSAPSINRNNIKIGGTNIGGAASRVGRNSNLRGR